MARLYNDKRQGNHQVFSLVAVDESKIGGIDTVTMGLFDNKELTQQQVKASADKAYEMLKTMNSMFIHKGENTRDFSRGMNRL